MKGCIVLNKLLKSDRSAGLQHANPFRTLCKTSRGISGSGSVQVVHLKPHGLESWHQDCQNGTSSTKVHHLGADARVHAADALGCVELGGLPEERSWIVWR